MPVPRRACDNCRTQKLKCRWIEEISSCAQCQTKNKQCLMPPLPSGATHTSRQSGIALVPPDLSVHQRIAPNVSASTFGPIDERVKLLEDTIQELKSLLPVNLAPVQHPFLENSRNRVPLPSSSAQKRPMYQIMPPNERQNLTDTNVPVPSASLFEWQTSGTPDGDVTNQEFNVLALHFNLGLIQAEILEELFSRKARQRSIDLSVNVFNRMVARLEIWGRSSPLANRDTSQVETLLGRSGFIYAIMLEATLFEASYRLHAAKALCGFSHHLDVFSPDNLRTGARMVWPEIYLDAQRILNLAALISEGSMVFTWLAWKMVDALIAALCTALAFHTRDNNVRNAMLNTTNHEGKMRLYGNTMTFLDSAAAEANELDLTSKVNICRELFVQLNVGS